MIGCALALGQDSYLDTSQYRPRVGACALTITNRAGLRRTHPLPRAVLTVSKYEPNIVKLKSDLDPTVEDSAFGVCINLTKRWHLM
jgi:hypothetical protein